MDSAKLFDPLADAFVVLGADFSQELKPIISTEENISSPRAISYTPTILDCVPKGKASSDVIKSLPMFCMPGGVKFSKTARSPIYFGTIFTDEYRNRCNAYCLLFYDQSPNRDKNKAQNTTKGNEESGKNISTGQTEQRAGSLDDTGGGLLPIYKTYHKLGSDDRSGNSVSVHLPTGAGREAGHPLGEMGTNLQAQLDYSKKRKPAAPSTPSSANPSASDCSASSGDDSCLSAQETEQIELVPTGTPSKSILRLQKKSRKIRLARVNDDGLEQVIQPTRSKSSHEVIYSSTKGQLSSIETNENWLENATKPVEYYSKCFIVLTKFPYFQFFRDYLTQVYEYFIKKPKGIRNEVPLERYICNLIYEILLPPPSNDLQLKIYPPLGQDYPLYLSRPSIYDLPLLDQSVKTLFLCLDKGNIIKLLSALLLERKILFIASNPNLLYLISEAATSLLYPFTWEYVYIPNLPPQLIDYTQAPTPFVMGIAAEYIYDLQFFDETLVTVDLDNNTVASDGEKLIKLPKAAEEELLNCITEYTFPELKNIDKISPVIPVNTSKTSGGSSMDYGACNSGYYSESEEDRKKNEYNLRMSFVSFFVSVFGNLHNYINRDLEDTDDVFDADNYIASSVTEDKDFWQTFLKTTIFSAFIQKLASQENYLSIGLFVELTALTEKCRSPAEVFNTIMKRTYHGGGNTNLSKNLSSTISNTPGNQSNSNYLQDDVLLYYSTTEEGKSESIQSNKITSIEPIKRFREGSFTEVMRLQKGLKLTHIPARSYGKELFAVSLRQLIKGKTIYIDPKIRKGTKLFFMDILIAQDVQVWNESELNKINITELIYLLERYVEKEYWITIYYIDDIPLVIGNWINDNKIMITVNNPGEYDLHEFYWDPNSFPKFNENLIKKKIDNSFVMNSIVMALKDYKSSPELYLLKAYFHMQEYSELSVPSSLANAFQSCVSAYCIDQQCIPQLYFSTMLNKFSDSELTNIVNSNLKIPIVFKLAKSIIANRRLLLRDSNSDLTGIDDSSGSDSEMKSNLKTLKELIDTTSHLIVDKYQEYTSPTTIEISNRLKQFKLSYQKVLSESPSSNISYTVLHNCLKDHQFLPDDSYVTNKLVSSLGKNFSKKTLGNIFASFEKTLEDCDHIHKKFSSVLEPKEVPLFSYAASLTSGRRGNLLLTQQRLLFISKGKIVKTTAIREITSIQPHTIYALIPGGVPCIKYMVKGKDNYYSIWNSHVRNQWVACLTDLAAAWKMADDLADSRIIGEAAQNLILTIAVKRFLSKTIEFQYFKTAYPDKLWFTIPQVFLQKGMLNTEYVCEETVIDKPLTVVVEALSKLQLLMHTNTIQSPTPTLNFKQLKQAPEYDQFLRICAKLQRISLSKIQAEETTVLFVFLYNVIVIHAYIEIEAFPTCLWDWRYLEKLAYYTIGGVAYSIWDIHHGLLRHNQPAPYGLDVPFYESDPRKNLQKNIIFDPAIIFTLCNHTKYSPPIYKLDPSNLEKDIRKATVLFCEEQISIKEGSKVVISLPVLLKYYAVDLGGTVYSVLIWLHGQLKENALQKKFENLLLSPNYEVEWLESWEPSPKLLVGSHHFEEK